MERVVPWRKKLSFPLIVAGAATALTGRGTADVVRRSAELVWLTS
ncbi:hypothetical protein [Rhodococcus globerulus]|nr:hypothetical protein [Rhodococcus globerulus]